MFPCAKNEYHRTDRIYFHFKILDLKSKGSWSWQLPSSDIVFRTATKFENIFIPLFFKQGRRFSEYLNFTISNFRPAVKSKRERPVQFEVYSRVQLTLRIQRWLNGLRYLQQTQGCHQWELYKHNFQTNHRNHNNIIFFFEKDNLKYYWILK